METECSSQIIRISTKWFSKWYRFVGNRTVMVFRKRNENFCGFNKSTVVNCSGSTRSIWWLSYTVRLSMKTLLVNERISIPSRTIRNTTDERSPGSCLFCRNGRVRRWNITRAYLFGKLRNARKTRYLFYTADIERSSVYYCGPSAAGDPIKCRPRPPYKNA